MTGNRHFHLCAFLIFAIGLSGCAGTWVSSRPVYPASWPALVASDSGRTCPDLTGKYRAVSDEAGPLVYPPGGHPREMFMFVSYGKPVPVPPLGRRILPWHLAGAFMHRDHETWDALARYAAAIETDPASAGPADDASWVRMQKLPDDLIGVQAGLRDRTLLDLQIRKESQGFWNYKSHVYRCEDGGLVVIGAFPPPALENPGGRPSAVIGAFFTFYRTADGSLAALEEAYTGVGGGNMVFNKWWLWRRVE